MEKTIELYAAELYSKYPTYRGTTPLSWEDAPQEVRDEWIATAQLKKPWVDKGELYPSPNKPIDFELGKLLIQIHFAKDAWSTIDSSGYMQTYALSINSVKTKDNIKFWSVVIWKMKIVFGWRK